MADLTNGQLTALGNEITNDPKLLGYAGKTVAQRVALINALGGSSETIGSGVIAGYQLMNQIVHSEFVLLSIPNQNLFMSYVACMQIDASNATVQANFLAMFPSLTAPTTRANLIAFVNRSASRAEILFGTGTVITTWDMGRATGVPT